MGSIQKITFSLLNDILSRHKYYFHNLEFERGLGIIDDAFLLTLKSIDSSKVIVLKIFTNLRCFYKGKVILRYHDLFLDQQMKKMTIKMYESQKEIEKSLLQLELDEINSYFANKIIHSISFSPCGDLNISAFHIGQIVAVDDLDISKNGRTLYELLFVDTNETYGVILYEYKKRIIIKRTKELEIFPEKDNHGVRFLLFK